MFSSKASIMPSSEARLISGLSLNKFAGKCLLLDGLDISLMGHGNTVRRILTCTAGNTETDAEEYIHSDETEQPPKRNYVRET